MSNRGVAAIALILSIAAFAAPAQAQQAAAYWNDLEDSSDTTSWYFYGYPSQWWNVDATPIAGHNSNASLNYNNGQDVNSGSWGYGYFETTPINLTGMVSPILSWWCLHDLPDPNNVYVYREIDMYDANQNYYYYFYVDIANADINCGSANTWHQHTMPVPGDILSTNSMRFFAFIEVDPYGAGAGFDGWFIDDIQFLVDDVTPPDAITDLAASGATLTEMTVTWSAPYDDDISGVTASYDLRYSTSPITGANFSSATQLSNEPIPDVEGTVHTVQLTGLTEDTTYYFAIRTTDIAGNPSAISNVASLATLAPPPPPPTPSTGGGSTEVKDLRADDILPCAAGTSAVPTGVFALAGLVALAFAVRRK